MFIVPMVAQQAAAGSLGTTEAFSGTATVGESIGGGSIPQSGVCSPTGKGLHAPGFHGSGKNKSKGTPVVVNKELYYHLSVPDLQAAVVHTNRADLSGAFHGPMDICGIVSPGPAGIGAACGNTTGSDGKGEKELEDYLVPAAKIAAVIVAVVWPPTAGAMIAVYGIIDYYEKPANLVSSPTFLGRGTFYAVVHVAPSTNCMSAKPTGGATSFPIQGVAVSDALVN